MSRTGLDAAGADKQVPHGAVHLQGGHLPSHPRLTGRRLRDPQPAATWAMSSDRPKAFVTEKKCVRLLEQHFLGSCKINRLGRMLLQVLHLQRGKEGMKLWSELARMKNCSGLSSSRCKLENSEPCGTTAEAPASKRNLLFL